jgi:hypothetical protein
MRLTQKIVDAALYEGRSYTSKSGRKRWRQHVLADDALPGFGLRISSSNRKSFFVSYRADGRRRTRTLGTVDRMSLKKARLLAAERLAEAPPAADQGPLDDIETVAQLANAYLDKHLKPNSPSWFADQRLIRTHIKPAMGRSPIAQVSQNEIISLTSRVGRRFPADARRLRSLLKGMFDWAEERGLWSRSAGAAEAAGAQTATNGKTTTGVAKGKAPKKKRPAGERGAKPAAKASRKGSSKPTRRPSAKALADSLQRSRGRAEARQAGAAEGRDGQEERPRSPEDGPADSQPAGERRTAHGIDPADRGRAGRGNKKARSGRGSVRRTGQAGGTAGEHPQRARGPAAGTRAHNGAAQGPTPLQRRAPATRRAPGSRRGGGSPAHRPDPRRAHRRQAGGRRNPGRRVLRGRTPRRRSRSAGA